MSGPFGFGSDVWPGIAKLIEEAGAVVYVGRSAQLRSRLQSHRLSGRSFDEARIIPCEPDVAVWLERELIRTLQPSTNILRYKRHHAAASRDLRRRGLG